MFQFSGFASLAGYQAFGLVGCPIRVPMDRGQCAATHGLSQLVAPFIACESLGIPHTPFSTSIPPQAVGQLHVSSQNVKELIDTDPVPRGHARPRGNVCGG